MLDGFSICILQAAVGSPSKLALLSESPFCRNPYHYDNLGRLTSSTRHTGEVQLLSYTERDLACDHNSNSLSSITGSVSAAYTYDNNGNMAGDGRKNLQMQYNLINLPQTVNQGSVSKARYIWLSDGTKASVVADTLSNNGYTSTLRICLGTA